MSQILNEQMSALLDGELPVEQEELLLRQLDSDPKLRERLARYSLAGDLLSDRVAHPGALSISDRVRAALAGADASSSSAASRPPARAVGSGLIGAGMAAAIALVAFINLAPLERSGDDITVAQIAATPAPSNAADDHHHASIAPARLTRYLVSYAEYANPMSRQFVDSHLVMPTFQRAGWQTAEINE